MARRRDRETPEEATQARELDRHEPTAEPDETQEVAARRREVVEDEAAAEEAPDAELPDEDWLPGEEEVMGAEPDEDPSSSRVERMGRHYLERATGTEGPDPEKPRAEPGLHVEDVEGEEDLERDEE